MRKSAALLLILFSLMGLVSCVQATQNLPFYPPGNVTGNYTFAQGNDFIEMNTNFPMSSQDIVYPEWLFGLMLIFIFCILCFALYLMSTGTEKWVEVIACGIVQFGLGAAAAMMAPLVGYSQVFHQVIPQVLSGGATQLNSTNTIYVNHIIVYTFGPWIGYACWGLAVGGLVVCIAGWSLQTKQARKIADQVQQERILAAEMDPRIRDRK